MTETLQSWAEWAADNPWVVGLLAVYLVANLAPRKHPDDAAGASKLLWWLLDRLSWLTSEAMPGRFKWLLKGSVREPDAASPQPSDPEDTDT